MTNLQLKARIAALAMLLAAPYTAFACGESLFHVGQGVAFRDYTAPIPGKILIVVHDESDNVMAERLAAAGHDVRVIAHSSQISHELSAGDVDIVMTMFRERQEVAQQMQLAASTASYLPVAIDGTEEEAEARALSKNSLSSHDNLKRFLRAIHRTLKSQKL